MNKELILLKLESSLVILEEYYTMDMFDLETENDILDGLGEPRDFEMESVLDNKFGRILLIKVIRDRFRFAESYSNFSDEIKVLKGLNKKLEAGDSETEYEICNKIVKLIAKKIFN